MAVPLLGERMVSHLRHLLAWAIGHLWKPRKESPEELRAAFERGGIQRVLIIRPHQGLGDLLLATPFLRTLKKNFPNLSLHVLPSTYNVRAIGRHPDIARLWVWDKKAMRWPWRLGKFLRGLRRERFDLAIPLFSNAPSLTSFLIARFSGAARVLSYDTSVFPQGGNWSRRLADIEIPPPPPETPEVEKFLALLRPLVSDIYPTPYFHVSPEEKAQAERDWQMIGHGQGEPVVALFLGGNPRRLDRLWPPKAWASLARRLQQEKIRVVAVTPPPNFRGGGGVFERGFFEEFQRYCGEGVPTFDHPGLERVAAFLKGVRLFICHDGGLYHTACAAGVPTLGLFIQTEASRWKPPVSWAHALQAPQGRPEALTPEAVWEAVKKILTPECEVKKTCDEGERN